MSNPIEKYLNESGRDVLIIEKDKFLNKQDIVALQFYVEECKEKNYYSGSTEWNECDKLISKLEYIRGLLK